MKSSGCSAVNAKNTSKVVPEGVAGLVRLFRQAPLELARVGPVHHAYRDRAQGRMCSALGADRGITRRKKRTAVKGRVGGFLYFFVVSVSVIDFYNRFLLPRQQLRVTEEEKEK